MQIAVLITTYNRVNTTLKCLESLYKSQLKNSTFEVYLVDGGSTDETVLRVRQEFSNCNVSVVEGLYWNRGILEAWKKSIESTKRYDAFLWLNDDVHLNISALQEVVNTLEKTDGRCIVVGYTKASGTDEITYGALKRRGKSKINFQTTADNSDQIVTMNGNCVLISKTTQELIGLLNPRFQHSFGDIDYGLRATEAGIGIVSTTEAVAALDRHFSPYSTNTNYTFAQVIDLMRDPKGIPFRELLYFTKRHAGTLWPLHFVLRYLKMLW